MLRVHNSKMLYHFLIGAEKCLWGHWFYDWYSQSATHRGHWFSGWYSNLLHSGVNDSLAGTAINYTQGSLILWLVQPSATHWGHLFSGWYSHLQHTGGADSLAGTAICYTEGALILWLVKPSATQRGHWFSELNWIELNWICLFSQATQTKKR